MVSNVIHSPLGLALLTKLLCTEAFIPSSKASFGLPNRVTQLSPSPPNEYVTADTTLFAKKKKGKAPIANMDFDLFDDEDEPMSKKDQIKAEKAAAKAAKKQQAEAKKQANAENVPTGKKDRNAAALKALAEMERMEAQMANSSNEENKPKLSKKEAKEAAKKAAKQAKKDAARELKRAAKRAAAAETENSEVELDVTAKNGEAAPAVSKTLF